MYIEYIYSKSQKVLKKTKDKKIRKHAQNLKTDNQITFILTLQFTGPYPCQTRHDTDRICFRKDKQCVDKENSSNRMMASKGAKEEEKGQAVNMLSRKTK